MRLTNEALRSRWDALSAEVGGYTRIDSVHPLELYIGFEASAQRSLLLISGNEPSQVPSSRSILVNVGQRGDGRWAITFRLILLEQEAVFIQLCCDLIEASRHQPSADSGAEFVLSRYRRWHRLMEHQGTGLLSEPARRGLLGELLFLQRVLAAGLLPLDALNGWIGPAGADRDFVYSDGWHEIKAVGASATEVTISSLEQLDAPPPGELVVFFIEATAPEEQGSFSLNGKVNELRLSVEDVPAALEQLDAKLLDIGYIALREYDQQHYRIQGIRRYVVDAAFPRLTRANVRHEISGVAYTISLNALESWRTE